MHFDFYHAVTLACFASTTLHVEGKSIGLPTSGSRLARFSKEFSNKGEGACISGRVRTWRTTNRTLVNQYRTAQIFRPSEGLAIKGLGTSVTSFESGLQVFIKNFVDERRFT